MRKKRVATLCVFLALVGLGAPSALANPNDEQYGNQLGQQFKPPKTTSPKTASSPVATAKPGGTLPFTGLDLVVVAAAGGAAVAGGVGLRKLGRKRDQQS